MKSYRPGSLGALWRGCELVKSYRPGSLEALCISIIFLLGVVRSWIVYEYM